MANTNTVRLNTWSDLNHDMLLVIMMKVGVVDFLAFSRVCKSWRTFALSNKNKFMASKQPMLIEIHRRTFRKDWCDIEDSNGRKIKRTLRHCGRRKLVGLTCGYLILYGRKNRDFWLVNPITNHELHFPGFPFGLDDPPRRVRGILVFSPSMSGWVFVMTLRYCNEIWFSIAGQGAWTHFTSEYYVMDLHASKGKVYIITTFGNNVCELRLNPQPKVTLLETKNLLKVSFSDWEIVSSGESLYVMGRLKGRGETVWELETCEMKWVQPRNTRVYAYYINNLKHGAYAIKLPYPLPQCVSYARFLYFQDKSGKVKFRKMWYFPYDI